MVNTQDVLLHKLLLTAVYAAKPKAMKWMRRYQGHLRAKHSFVCDHDAGLFYLGSADKPCRMFGKRNPGLGCGKTSERLWLLVAHSDVDKVAFTGSTDVGKKIQKALAGTNKWLMLDGLCVVRARGCSWKKASSMC